MRSLLCLVGIVAVATYAAAGLNLDILDFLDYLPGKNLTEADEKFTYRYSNARTFNLPLASDILAWVSASVDASSASSQAKASGNAMVGVGALPTIAYPPFAMLAYGSGSGAVDVDALTFLSLLISEGKLDASFEGGAIGLIALNMQEFDRDGNAVGDPIPLKTADVFPCKSEELTGDDGNITGISCTFTPADTTAKVTITYVTSKKAGFLNYAKTPVSPRSVEMIIQVTNFPLSVRSNHVRLTFGFLTAAGTGTVDGTATVVRRPFVEDVYTAAAKHGVVDGNIVELEVALKVGSAELEATADAVMKAALGANFDAQIATVDFPAGVGSFIYDPVIGAGYNVYAAAEKSDTSSSAATSSTSSASSSGKASSVPAGSSTPAGISNGSSFAALSLLVVLVTILVYLF